MHIDESKAANREVDCAVREAVLGDFEAICQVRRRNGMGALDYLDWARLWNDNPFRFDFQVPMGWVLESKAKGIVGSLSNIPRMYSLNNEPVRVAVANAWVIDTDFRWSAIALTNNYFSQKQIDVFLNTTASPEAGRIFKAYKCKEVPSAFCTQMLFWITNYVGFARALLGKVRAPKIAGIKYAAGLALYCRDLAYRHRIRHRQKDVLLLPRFDERFDAMWELLSRRTERLLAVRTSEALTWQFRPAMKSGEIVILGIPEGEKLSAYLIMKSYDQEQFGLRRFRVVDIQATHDEADAIPSLMSAALEHAARSGADVVEAMGFDESKHDLLEGLHPHHRLLPSCPYLYRVSADSQRFRSLLERADAWDPSPFDGDASL